MTMLRRAPTSGAQKKRKTGVKQASIQRAAAQPDRNQPRTTRPQDKITGTARAAVMGGGLKRGLYDRPQGGGLDAGWKAKPPPGPPQFTPPATFGRPGTTPFTPPQRNIGPTPYSGPTTNVAGVLVHNQPPPGTGTDAAGNEVLPVGWAQVSPGVYVQNWNGLTPEQRSALAAYGGSGNDAYKQRMGGVGQEVFGPGYQQSAPQPTTQQPAPVPGFNGMTPYQPGPVSTTGQPINFQPDANPAGAGQYQGPGGGMGWDQARLMEEYGKAKAMGGSVLDAFLSQHPRLADQLGIGMPGDPRGAMPTSTGLPGVQMPGRDGGATPGTPPRQFASAIPQPTNLQMPGTGARGTTPGTPNRVYMPPTQTGNSTGGGGGQQQPNSNANPIEMNPDYVRGVAALDDELARTLTELGVSEADLNATMDLIKSRLNVGHQEDRRLTNETMNARGLYNSGIRQTGLGKVDYDYGTKYQDLDLERISGLRGIANARSAAHSAKKRGVADLVLDIAAAEAANPGFDVAGNYSGPEKRERKRSAPKRARRKTSKKRKRKNRG